jgi:heat shock protein HspQ
MGAAKPDKRPRDRGAPSSRRQPPYIASSRQPAHLQPVTNMTEPTTQAEDAPTPASFTIGDVVRHRVFPFRGVIFDVDPEFNNTEEWWQSIPEEIRPRKNQPFYHLFAENEESTYVAYVSQQNLLPDGDGDPVSHPGVVQMFDRFENGRYRLRKQIRN